MVMQDNRLSPITVLPIFTRQELRKINLLVQEALLSDHMQQRLLNMDETLQMEFSLSDSVWESLTSIQAITMADFCGELLDLQTQASI